MKYENIKEGIFLQRPNRFIAHVEIEGKIEIVHVKNTGRCKELLIPGCKIYVEENDLPHRKTKFDLISVYKGNKLINMDSQAPNKVVLEWVRAGKFLPITMVKPEKTFGNSRFDLYMETEKKRIFVEVKGVTLEENGIALFPDAPTERGVKHLLELCKCVKDGYEAYVIFVIQMEGVQYFTPNNKTHKEFGESLQVCKNSGVNILAYDCSVTKDTLNLRQEVKVAI